MNPIKLNRNTILFTALISFLAPTLSAETVLNPVTGEWVIAPVGTQPKLNPMNGDWEMAPDDAELEMNTVTGEWSYYPTYEPQGSNLDEPEDDSYWLPETEIKEFDLEYSDSY